MEIEFRSNMKKKNTPVIIGAAQITQQKDLVKPLDPLNLIAKASVNAFKMSGIKKLPDIMQP